MPKVKVRKTQVRRIEKLIDAGRTRARDVEGFVEAAVAAAIKSSHRPRKPAKPRTRATKGRGRLAKSPPPRRATAAAGGATPGPAPPTFPPQGGPA